ncbi:MAG: ABC transporter ATP-binding protein [Candidatus Kariarchaeaceae archaeon]|jgi:lipopolysaccharide transport system ATP-binding protein
MSDISIKVEHLSKMYDIGLSSQRHDTLRDQLADVVFSPFRRKEDKSENRTFWALKDVSFEVVRGEVLGIIGRNGAGKSTLLKLLSRITEPTSGRAVINGRVGSLLEVGTGFHPELTGRENIFLNGAILGMHRTEIARKFDEIVAFAEIDKFLDMPVKRYSSGMYVRLAFAVAAHLEPEILLVDEVLAVGDVAFQKKCLGKMGDVAKEGRTVLFVSHNLASISNLSHRACLIDQGKLTIDGGTEEVIRFYMQSINQFEDGSIANDESLLNIKQREGDGQLFFSDFKIFDARRNPISLLKCGEDVTFELCYSGQVALKNKNVAMSIAFFDIFGRPLFLCRSDIQGKEFDQIPQKGSVYCRVPKLPLPPGDYRINLHAELNGSVADWLMDAYKLTVIEGDYFGSGRLPDRGRGGLLVDHFWLHSIDE